MKRNSVWIFVFLLMFSCSTTQYKSFPYYSVVNENLQGDSLLYKDVPIIQTNLAKELIFINPEHKIDEKNLSNKLTGIVACQPLINTNGEVNAIIINQSLSPLIDSLVMEDVKALKFKSLKELGGPDKKYSLLIRYFFSEGKMIGPPEIDVSKEKNQIEFPRVKRRAVPDYEEIARESGAQGIVVVRVFIRPDGKVTESYVIHTDNELLNETSIQAANQFEFEPFSFDEYREGIWLSIPFTYRIRGD